MRGPVYQEPPDGGWGWMVVLAGFLMNTLSYGILRSFGVFFNEFVHYFEESASRVSWVASIALATQQLTSLGWGLSYSSTMGMVSRYFKRRRVLAVGMVLTGVGIGSFVLSLLFQVLIDTFAWRGTLHILSAVVLNLCVCGALLRPIALQDDLRQPNDKRTINGNKGLHCFRELTSIFDFSLMKQRAFFVFCLATVMISMGYFMPYVHLVAHGSSLGLTKYEAAFVISLTSITDTVARLFSGWLADLKLLRTTHFLFIWNTLTGLSLILLPFGKTYTSLVALGLLYGFCAGGLVPVFFGVVTDLVGVSRVLNGTGLSVMMMSVGGLLGPPLSGWLRDITGAYTVSFFTCGGFLLLGSLALLALPSFFSSSPSPSEATKKGKDSLDRGGPPAAGNELLGPRGQAQLPNVHEGREISTSQREEGETNC
ncbi:monocarboxylate transporter 13-like isoform X2 [Latimeria chalumnae]|uniref:monocarboxylate transporter 13-like isoform X2 n=1 Tax=Latimeria chalumnae TaxID=7897 RepID=UPI0003C1874E|nr:PREDICTED: monocarboxylate transporter 13-like isoform X2 [Latimeria chalumnae]|eukprot:XP_006009537.1 PREDICTED: monocarboxylate transporter 13-like isoform X2 [Latimeria chalumnae]